MTTFSTVPMLTNVEYGSPSGNYDGSSQDWYSTAVPAANYYAGYGSVQTIRYELSGFVGRITIEATLNDLPEQAQWFEISQRGDMLTPDSGVTTSTVTGNFSWVRARVEGFDAGTITLVSISY